MDSLKHRKDKVKLIKGMLRGDISLRDKLTPKVYTIYSLAPDKKEQYTSEGRILTTEERQRLEDQAGNRPVIWVNIVCREANKIISLPHNNRDSITAPIYSTFNSSKHIKQ